MRRRLLSIGHSYVVAENRSLPNAFARTGGTDWDVTIAAPERYPGDLGPLTFSAHTGDVCRTVAVPVHGARRPHVMRYGRALRRLLAEPWDVIHCWEEPYIVAASQIAHWAGRDATLVYATFQNIGKRYPPPFGALERYALGRAAGWIAFGHTVADALRDRRAWRDRPYRVIAPGVDTVRFAPDHAAGARVRQSLGWTDEGPPVVGFLGRFVAGKGWAELTRRLDRVDTPWRALFVGGGAGESALRVWASAHGDRVRVVTGVPHAEVPAWLNAMDVLCAPSLSTPGWREQFGRMVAEAMACGVPVIASSSGELPHVVGEAGIVVGEADEDEWVRHLADLLAASSTRRRLGEAGRGRALAAFAVDHVARAHLTFFAELLTSRER